jgi:hypothetical protein
MNQPLHNGGVISLETIKKFQAAVQLDLGVALSEQEAREYLLNWVGYFDLLAKIDHRQEIKVS